MVELGKKHIITLDEWFTAPDGKTYISVFGTIKEQSGGLIEIGNAFVNAKRIISIIRSNNCELGEVDDWNYLTGGYATQYKRPSKIYNADQAEKPKNNVVEIKK